MNECSIHYAAFDGNLEKMRQLIETGVPVDSLDEEGETPLHVAAWCGQFEVAELLINSKCNINFQDRRGRTPVMLAAEWLRKDIVDLLLHRGAQVNCVDDYGETLLHLVVLNGWTDTIRLILDNGEADLNAVDFVGETPLMCALLGESKEVAVVLIQAGADITMSNNFKRTVLHFAAQEDHTRVIQILLEKEGLDLNPQDVRGYTPLHLACLFHCHEAIKQLLDAGADTNVKNNRGRTALSEGICQGTSLTHEEIRLFVEKGAFLENCDYAWISEVPILKENLLKDVELCTQSIVNKFNRQSLPALNSIGAYFARRLPNVDNFKLGTRHIDEVRNLVKCEIERNTFCNVVQVRPRALSALCVLSLIS